MKRKKFLELLKKHVSKRVKVEIVTKLNDDENRYSEIETQKNIKYSLNEAIFQVHGKGFKAYAADITDSQEHFFSVREDKK